MVSSGGLMRFEMVVADIGVFEQGGLFCSFVLPKSHHPQVFIIYMSIYIEEVREREIKREGPKIV